jgi:hypothetical protein
MYSKYRVLYQGPQPQTARTSTGALGPSALQVPVFKYTEVDTEILLSGASGVAFRQLVDDIRNLAMQNHDITCSE